jgi:membrane dipeptidase
MRTFLKLTGTAALAIAVTMAGAPTGAQQAGADDALVKPARAIHDKVITLDTHVDINPGNFVKYAGELTSQVSIPKMKAGGLDAAFFIVYVGQGELTQEGYDNAYKVAIEKFDAIHRLTKEVAPAQIGLALTSADARRLHKDGKLIAFIGVENGYPLGDEKTAIARVREFHERGARYLSLAHNGHSQLADSNNGEASGNWLHNGLSPLGRQVIEEMNRVGIMIDISHPSKQANLQTMALSKAPVIASHSSARALWNHSRNLDDEELDAVKKNGGVVQTVAFASYVKVNQPSPERLAAQAALRKELGLAEGAPLGGRGGGRGGRGGAAQAQMTEEEKLALQQRNEAIQKRVAELDAKFPPPPRASISDFVDHIDYLVKKIGIDHVGISSDFDGGGGVEGWMNATETFNVTLELVRRGYTEEQIEKLWSGNLLRVLDEVQRVAGELRKS